MGPFPFPQMLGDGADDIRLFFLAVSFLAGAAYFFARRGEATFTRAVIKTTCVAALAVFAAMSMPANQSSALQVVGILLVLALVFSALGDYFLAFDGDKNFVRGLASFLTGHIFYVICFAYLITPESASIANKIGGAVILVLFAIGIFSWLRPGLGDMKIPVAAYVTVISLMGVTAILAPFFGGWVVLGAILFMLSDSLIAADRFKEPLAYVAPYIGEAIWGTYIVAQYLITLGLLWEMALVAGQ